MPREKTLCPRCGRNTIDPRASQCFACRYGHPLPSRETHPSVAPIVPLSPAESIEADRKRIQDGQSRQYLQEKYTEALKRIEQLEREAGTVRVLREGLAPYAIGEEAQTTGTPTEATALVLASDWHYEETVGPETGGINVYNREIATERIQRFFRKANSLTDLMAEGVNIPTMVLALLGDFITNDIHEGEQAEANSLAPVHALLEVQNHIASGIEYLLRNSSRSLVIPCHSGNHARITRKTRFHAENGHSLEFLMYNALAGWFRNEPRVQFRIADAPHSYLDIQGMTVRFRHGHDLRYGGGVGGLYIPVNKALDKDNRARHADFDVFGHYHQLVDGGHFVCNGSLIGYSSFSMTNHFIFEPPKQTLILFDNKRGRTATWPIYV